MTPFDYRCFLSIWRKSNLYFFMIFKYKLSKNLYTYLLFLNILVFSIYLKWCFFNNIFNFQQYRLDNFISEPNCDSIQVLARLSLNIHLLKPTCDLTIEDSDDEDEVQISEEQLLLSDYLNIMNKPEKVKKWLHFFEVNNGNMQVLNSFTQLCHNLLLVYKDSIRKYL